MSDISIFMKNSQFAEDVRNFRENSMTHVGADEFFSRRGIDMKHYKDIHLSVEYEAAQDDRTKIEYTELSLAREAKLNRGCSFVTNIDYCGPCIAATGWIKKSGR